MEHRLSRPLMWAVLAVAVAVLAAVAVLVARSGDGAGTVAGAVGAEPPVDAGQGDPGSGSPGNSQVDPPGLNPTTVNGVVLPDREVVPPVPFDEPAQIAAGFSAEVTSVQAIEGVGQGPGEISGPAVMFTVSLTNNGTRPLTTLGVEVNAYGADASPAPPLLGDPNAEAMPRTVPPGKTVTGVFVFTIPQDQRGNVTLTLAFDAETPTVVFTGAV